MTKTDDAAPAAEPYTMSVPAAGRLFYDLGRNGSYAAAARGDLITIKVGKLLKVPVAAQKRKLEGAS
jgi:hypothetical protein